MCPRESRDVLSRLLKILPPPSESPFDIDFGKLERRGIEAPADYRWFVRHYGAGLINGSFTVLAPATEDASVDLLDTHEEMARSLLSAREDGLIDVRIFPEPGGLLMWASADDGTSYYWKTEGPSHSWPVVRDGGELDFEDLPEGTVEVIVAVAEHHGNFEHGWLDDEGNPTFEPIEAADGDDLAEEDEDLAVYEGPIVCTMRDGIGAGEVSLGARATKAQSRALVEDLQVWLKDNRPAVGGAIRSVSVRTAEIAVAVAGPGSVDRLEEAVLSWWSERCDEGTERPVV